MFFGIDYRRRTFRIIRAEAEVSGKKGEKIQSVRP